MRPDLAEPYNNLALVFVKQGKVHEAIDQLRQALAVEPGHAIAHRNLGSALLLQGKQEEGIRQLRRAVRIDPDYANAHRHLAQILQARGRIDEAIVHWRSVARIEPRNAQARLQLTARGIMKDVVERTARQVFIPLTVGGGIRSVQDARGILVVGADKVSVNTAAVERPELITELSEEFGAQAIVPAIDARRNGPGRWNVYTYGGRKDTGIDAVEWAARGEALGAGEILLTSMDRDGTQVGFDCDLTRAVSRATCRSY